MNPWRTAWRSVRPRPAYTYLDPDRARMRRLVAVGAFGALAVVGAAGSYLAVAGGLGSLLVGEPAESYPPAATAAPVRREAASNAGLGRGRVVTRAPSRRIPATRPTPTAPARTTRVTRPSDGPDPSDCDCLAPPVPTPTEPSQPASESPSVSPSESLSETPSASPSPSESVSASPTEWASPDPSPSPETRRSHH